MTPTLAVNLDEGRFSRQQLITWWDQGVLERARILVVGAGALGNELLKNLALLGVGNIFVVDLDVIENSNLSRTVLFRERHLGQAKAPVAAEAVRELFPAARVRGLQGNVVYDLGLGVFAWADLVVCGLDNREARLEVNRNCWKVGKPWLDGAIEGLEGQLRMFAPPDGACYECTMSVTDWKLLAARRSCALLSRGEMAGGKVPTVATTSSVVAALQSQEVVKHLHGIGDLAGHGIVFQGKVNDFYRVAYQRRDECYSHMTLAPPLSLGRKVADVTVGEALEIAGRHLGGPATIDLNHDVLREFECTACNLREPAYRSLGKATEDEARCPACGRPRTPHVVSSLDADCNLLDRTLGQLGVPPLEMLAARSGERETTLFFDADADDVLGELTHDY